MTIRVGTASWTDPTLIKCKCFYPLDAKTAEQRLQFYASKFDTVEVDSTYYAMPGSDTALAWVERTPPGFVFDVKAFRLFTLHQTPIKALPSVLRDEAARFANDRGNVYYPDIAPEVKDDLWRRFTELLAPLKEAGKLGYVLFQLPPWVMKRRSNFEHLAECAERLDGFTVAVEFRNATWFKEEERGETLANLREQNLALVIVDEPQGTGVSIPSVWEATSPDLSVVRFHGRNQETWTKKNLTAAERFNYLYSEEELRALAGPVDRLARETRQVHAIFNNCYEDKAIRNATRFIELLANKP